MSKSFNETVFGPLSKKYCMYFYYLSVLGYILFILAILSALYLFMTTKQSMAFLVQMLFASLGYGIFYFQNRLLYSMCNNSL